MNLHHQVAMIVNPTKKKFYVNWLHSGGMVQNNKWSRHRTPWLQWAATGSSCDGDGGGPWQR
jgi:hypothetical protein